jgi:hypothetical protein
MILDFSYKLTLKVLTPIFGVNQKKPNESGTYCQKFKNATIFAASVV